MKSRLTSGAIALALAMFMIVAVGCSDDDDNPAAPDMGSGAMVRVIHASPDAPAVDIYAEGVAAPLITDLAYGETSAYLDLDPGTYNIQIRAAGAPASPEAFRVIPLFEEFTAAGAGNAIVRIVHAGADAPTVAVDVGNDGAPEITDFERYEDTGEAGVPLPAGEALQVAIWAGNPLSRVTVFTTPELPEGAELFVIATGLLGKLPRQADGFALLAVGPSGSIGFIRQNPVVFALHASPDAPAVDIFAGNATFTVLPLGDGSNLGTMNPLVRVLHASPDAPAVDVGVVNGGFTPVPGLTNLAYTQSSAAAGTAVPAASLTIGLAGAGTTNPVATFDVTPTAGLKAFVVASGSLLGTGETFRLVLVNTSVFPWVAAEVLPN